MLRFWSVLPEIENVIWILDIGYWVSFLTMDKVWELNWVINEENWGVVANHIKVSFLSIELNGKSSWISVQI
jgi:hypothetical protein